MARREREILEHAVHTIAEQAAKADELVDEAKAAGGGDHPVTVYAKMLRLELLKVKGIAVARTSERQSPSRLKSAAHLPNIQDKLGIKEKNMKTDLPPSPPAFFPEARPKRPAGLIVSTAVLGALLAGAVIFALVQTASLSSTRDDMAAAVAKGDKALTASKDANAVLEQDLNAAEEDLTAAEAQAASCERAANLLAKGQTGYVRLYNRVLDLANTFRAVFDTTLYVALNKDEVSNAQINAAWDALDECTTSGGTNGIDLA